MTDEELDRARADEAWRIYMAQTDDRPTAHQIAARLAREGWMPVDPDLIEARECAALMCEEQHDHNSAEAYRRGEYDLSRSVEAALVAIRRAKERK